MIDVLVEYVLVPLALFLAALGFGLTCVSSLGTLGLLDSVVAQLTGAAAAVALGLVAGAWGLWLAVRS